MYPNLYYALKDLFGIDVPFFKVINSFGFFVALSFLAAAWLLIKELRRKQALGEFTYVETAVQIGKPAPATEIIINFLLGFFLGYKILGVLFVEGALNDPQSFIFSKQGSWPAGLILGFFFGGLKWWEKNKNKLPKPEERKIRIWPSDRVGEIVVDVDVVLAERASLQVDLASRLAVGDHVARAEGHVDRRHVEIARRLPVLDGEDRRHDQRTIRRCGEAGERRALRGEGHPAAPRSSPAPWWAVHGNRRRVPASTRPSLR